MKTIRFSSRALLLASLCAPASADTIYSNLLDTPIPTDFTGVFLNVDGGAVNPFFGGVGVANDNLFQPVRSGTGNLDTIQNLTVGSVVDAGKLFSTGSGGSQDHLGNTFTGGQEGYLGFRTGTAGSYHYGWMRVVFTGNTGGAVIKDWAYDNSGNAINIGRVQQSAPSGGAQLVTLSPGSGESFTLGSAVSDTGGNINSVLKTGAGTTVLSQANTHSGATTVDAGTLKITGSIGGSAVTVNNSGSVLASGVTGTIGNSVTINNGAILAAGGQNAIGTATVNNATTLNSGGIFAWDLDASTADPGADAGNQGSYDRLKSASAAGGDAVFQIVLAAGDNFADAFWDTNKTWTNIFANAADTAAINWTSVFSGFSGAGVSADGLVAGQGQFTFNGSNTLQWSAVPETSTALAGLLLSAGLLRRRRGA